MGKPYKKSRNKRSGLLTFNVSRDEKKIFLAMAQQRRSSFAEMVRQILYRELKNKSTKVA
jgi:hypothetical protein